MCQESLFQVHSIIGQLQFRWYYTGLAATRWASRLWVMDDLHMALFLDSGQKTNDFGLPIMPLLTRHQDWRKDPRVRNRNVSGLRDKGFYESKARSWRDATASAAHCGQDTATVFTPKGRGGYQFYEELVSSSWLYFSGLQNHCRWWLQPWN